MLVRKSLVWAIAIIPTFFLQFSLMAQSGDSATAPTNAVPSAFAPIVSTGGVTADLPSTYTPGGPAISITITLANGAGGFELSAVTGKGFLETQAGDFTAGANTAIAKIAGIEHVYQTSLGTSFSLTWTPPAKDVGSIAMWLAGVSGGHLYANLYTLTPTGSAGDSITVNPSALVFESIGGATPNQKTFMVTTSGNSVSFTTAVSTTPPGGTWLTATPPGGNSPMSVTVSVAPAGLAAGTYHGSVSVTASGASNSPQTVHVTLNVLPAPPPPELLVFPGAMTFISVGGGAAAPQMVEIRSLGAPVNFTSAVSTASGGAWLSLSAATGTTPAKLTVKAEPTSLAVGTYKGTVTFTAPDASNSPQTLAVTLMVLAPPPPPTTPPALVYGFYEIDERTAGSDPGNRLALDGFGSVDTSQKVSGGGRFFIYTANSTATAGRDSVVALGTWTPTGFTSFTRTSGTAAGDEGGVLVIAVKLSIQGGTTETGTMRIADTGSDSGVTLTLDNGAAFGPTGVGRVFITTDTTHISAPLPTGRIFK